MTISATFPPSLMGCRSVGILEWQALTSHHYSVTGGKLRNETRTNAANLSGSGIDGGQSRHVAKGDVFVVPAGVPHWFKEVPKSVSYFVVKVLKP